MESVTKPDIVRNERNRWIAKVGEISNKVQESRLKWYGHILRREEYVGNGLTVPDIPSGTTCQGRKHKSGLNGGDSYELSNPLKSVKGCRRIRRQDNKQSIITLFI